VVVPALLVSELLAPELVVDDVAASSDEVAVLEPVESSSDAVFVEAALTVALVLVAAVCAVPALWLSCQASTPPRESIAVTLSAAAALRALAARGLRRPGRGVGPRRAAPAGVGVCSSMSKKVRTPDEGVARAG
jgi:hypothetical protein